MIRCKLIERSVVGTTQGATHVGRSVSGETLTMGRGASCKIYLPDPAIRLDHATIHRAEDGFLYLEAHGPVFVDQKPQTTCRLEVGQTLVLGPYRFQLDALEAGPGVAVVDMVLLYSVDESASTSGPSLADQLQVAKRPGFFRRRWLAWVLTTLVVVWGGLLPLWTAYHPPEKSAEVGPEKNVQRARAADVFWNPGQIASAHQSVGNDCRQCHEKPFERVKDASCQSCHTTVGGHAAHPGMDEAAFNNQRCASCHKEHQGVDGMKKVDAMGCVQCHGDITRFAPKSQLENIADFISAYIIGNLLQRAFRFGALRRWVFPDVMGGDPETTLESVLSTGGITEAIEDEIEARHTVVTPLRPRRSAPDDQYSSESNVSKTS